MTDSIRNGLEAALLLADDRTVRRLAVVEGTRPLGTLGVLLLALRRGLVDRDEVRRLIYGARISLFVGLAATTLNVVVATLIGGTSGFLGGKLDLAVQRFIDAWMAFPGCA